MTGCHPIVTEARLWAPTPSPQPGHAINVQNHPGQGWFPNLRDFDTLSDDVVLDPSAGWTQIHEYSVGDGYLGTLTLFGLDVDSMVAWQEVAWQVRVNGAMRIELPARGQQAGISPDLMRPVYVAMQEGVTVSIWAQNTSATTTNTVRASLKGHTWLPSAERLR